MRARLNGITIFAECKESGHKTLLPRENTSVITLKRISRVINGVHDLVLWLGCHIMYLLNSALAILRTWITRLAAVSRWQLVIS